MLIRSILCAALVVPVAALPPASNKVTKPSLVKPIVVPADSATVQVCPLFYLGYFDGTCEWIYEDCSFPLHFITTGACDLPEGGCPCEGAMSVVRMPDIDGRPAVAGRGTGSYAGMKAPVDAFRGGRLSAPILNEGVTLVYDGPAVVAGKPYRLFSVTHLDTRYDFGFEMVGVNAETVATYPRATVRAIFGNDLQATVNINGKSRTFQLRGVGESSVKEATPDKPLVPTPDNTVPPLK